MKRVPAEVPQEVRMLLEHQHVDSLTRQHEPEHRPRRATADHTARRLPNLSGLLGLHGTASFPLISGDRLHVRLDDLFDLLLRWRTRRPFGEQAVEDGISEQGSYEHACRRVSAYVRTDYPALPALLDKDGEAPHGPLGHAGTEEPT